MTKPFTPYPGFIPDEGDEPRVTLSPSNPLAPRQHAGDDQGEGFGGHVHAAAYPSISERNHGA